MKTLISAAAILCVMSCAANAQSFAQTMQDQVRCNEVRFNKDGSITYLRPLSLGQFGEISGTNKDLRFFGFSIDELVVEKCLKPR